MNGYFSLIQYCPVMERREAANVGVLLIVPETGYASARLSHDHGRLKKIFGKLAGEKQSVAVLLRSIAGRAVAEKEMLSTLEGLKQFISTRANRVMLTDPCAVLVEGNPEATLQELMEELVIPQDTPEKREAKVSVAQLEQQWLLTVTDRLLSRNLAPYLRRGMEVRVPRFISPLTAPLGYQNGRFHLIQPEEFSLSQESRIEERISLRAVQGEALYQHRDEALGSLQLTVVADFPPDRPDIQRMAQEVLREHHVRVYTRETLTELEGEIAQHGKVLTQIA